MYRTEASTPTVSPTVPPASRRHKKCGTQKRAFWFDEYTENYLYLKGKANFIGKGAFKLFKDFVVSCRCVYVNKRSFSD